MPKSTTRAGLAPRLFTPKVATLPRTPDSYGFLPGWEAFKGTRIRPYVLLAPRKGAAATFWPGRQRQINITLCNVGRLLQPPVTRRCRGGASGTGGIAAQFGNSGTSRIWA